MNLVLWVLQILLALHTAAGAAWKLSNPEQSVPSLKTIPHAVWIGLSVAELFVSAGLVLPAIRASLGFLALIGAGFVAAEMLFFTAWHLYSRDPSYGPVVYWLAVVAWCAVVICGRVALQAP